MKLLHLSDLHIGKRVNGFSMLPDQEYILNQIVSIAEREKPEAILIAGDVYDKPQPSAEAVTLLDDFLTRLTALKTAVFLISGNHDSPERLDFGSRILREKGLHIAGVFDGRLKCETLKDKHGPVNIFQLPFVKPAMVSPFAGRTIESYDEAVREAVAASGINEKERNILTAHQFVTAGGIQPERSESEAVSIGGVDNVDASAFDGFDYVALGHLHGPQRIGRDTVRYAGSPLKYSFSEVRQKKSLTIVELGEKGDILLRQVRLQPLRDMRKIRGPIDLLLQTGREAAENEDYISAVLTDEEEPYDALGRLRAVYPNLMCLEFEKNGVPGAEEQTDNSGENGADRKTPLELFADFYEAQNGEPMNERQLELLTVAAIAASERADRLVIVEAGEKK